MRKVVLYLLFFSSLLFSKEYAFIVTIGDYCHINNLKGANQDNKIYRKILKKWNIKNVVSLKNEEATKKNILHHLALFAKKIKKNDTFYMFFSGHGSSLYDEAYSLQFQEAGLTSLLRESGVIFPYDFNPKHIKSSIIIGKRDLKPYLKVIDKKIKKGIIVFDACYSEQSIRSNRQKVFYHTANILTQSDGYPYQNITYIASSITQAKSGKFSSILNKCLKKETIINKLKYCISRKIGKSFQIPIVLSNQ